MDYAEFMRKAQREREAESVEVKLARMRAILKDARQADRKAAPSDVNTHGEGSNFSYKPSGSHRDLHGSGQFVAPRVEPTDVLSLRRHLSEDHGLNPGYVGSLMGPSLHAAHDRVHADRGRGSGPGVTS
jgi:hypothetical protein